MKRTYKAQRLLGFIILWIIGGLLIPIAHAKIYRSASPDGAVVFSDVPRQGATQIVLPPVSHYSGPVLKKTQQRIVEAKRLEKKTLANPYDSVTITSLKNNDTVRNNNTLPIIVQAKVKPELQKGDIAQLLVDDKVFVTNMDISSDLAFTLKGVNRGMHRLKVVIVRRKTKQVISSSISIKIYFQQNSVRLLLSGKPENEDTL